MTRASLMQTWAVATLIAILAPFHVVKADATYGLELIFDDGFQPPVLTVNNYLSWCSITVNGGTASTAATISASFPHGTLVPLHAGPSSGLFVWGYWTGTDAAIATGFNDTSQDAAVTMSINRTLLACCPFVPNGTCP